MLLQVNISRGQLPWLSSVIIYDTESNLHMAISDMYLWACGMAVFLIFCVMATKSIQKIEQKRSE
jgi:hypothetical protein